MSGAREALEKAFDASPVEEVAAPVEVAPVEAAPAPVENTDTEPAPVEAEKTAAERARDEKGRFAGKANEKEKQTQAAAPKEAKPGVPGDINPQVASAPVLPPKPKFKPPQSWKPELREKWSTLAEEFQAEIDRREGESTKAIESAAAARKLHEQFTQTVAPYEMMIRARGADPMQVVGNFLQTGAQLQFGTPEQKAGLLANMVRSYGVPLELLAAAIDGAPANRQQQPGTQPAHIDPAQIAAQVEQRIQAQFQQRHMQAQKVKSAQEVQAFEASKDAEFINEQVGTLPNGQPLLVRDMMADLVDVADKQRRPMTLKEAHDIVVNMTPDLAKIIRQRQEAEAAKNAQASTERAKAASVSVRTQPAGVSTPGPKGTRQLLGEIAAKSGL